MPVHRRLQPTAKAAKKRWLKPCKGTFRTRTTNGWRTFAYTAEVDRHSFDTGSISDFRTVLSSNAPCLKHECMRFNAHLAPIKGLACCSPEWYVGMILHKGYLFARVVPVALCPSASAAMAPLATHVLHSALQRSGSNRTELVVLPFSSGYDRP